MTADIQFDPPPIFVDNNVRESLSDRRDGQVYVFDPNAVLAVRVALATRRPLLLLGDSGTGKSALAQAVARFKNWRYIEEVVTSRSEARDLLWTFDPVARLAAAQAGNKAAETPGGYTRPGSLWWAFDTEDARKLCQAVRPPYQENGFCEDDSRPAVVLIDEIDKADPDYPNALLVPLGSRQFTVPPLDHHLVRDKGVQPPLVIITSNNERPLPPAFLRRCVTHSFAPATLPTLETIANAHFSGMEHRIKEIAEKTQAWADSNRKLLPSIPEFLDLVKACETLRDEQVAALLNIIAGTAGAGTM